MMTLSYNPILSANQDIWYEILLRVSPKYIFRYMLVSKEWLELITSHSFRKDYTRRWEIEGSTMVGFMICDPGYTDIPRKWYPLPPSVQLLATSEIGRALNRSKLMKRAGYFMAATPNGRFILSAVHPRKYYVSDLVTRQRIKLPPPPKYYSKNISTAILEQQQQHQFKVIVANTGNAALLIQTFSSVTGEWEQSVLTCPTGFALQSGFVVKVIEDVVYWRVEIVDGGYRHIAPHHTNGRRRMINFIKLPRVGEGYSGAEYDEDTPTIICLFAESFDASPQGFLRYVAGTSTCFKVWVLLNHNSTETNSSTIDPWKLCYRVVLDSIWINNLDVLLPASSSSSSSSTATIMPNHQRPKTAFAVVSFVPGRSNCIFVRWEKRYFIYHLDTQQLETFPCYLDDDYGFPFCSKFCGVVEDYHPLTLSSIWPFLPLVETDNVGRIKV